MLGWCAISYLLGFDCPGCGLLRSIGALMQGEFQQSIFWHPMGVLVLLLGMNGWWLKKVLTKRGSKIVSYVFLFGLFFHWSLKMLLPS